MRLFCPSPRRGHLVALLLFVAAPTAAAAPSGGAAPARARARGAATEATPATAPGTPPPATFRCATMDVATARQQTTCRGAVVVRQGDWLLCCDTLVAQGDTQWQWQTLRCRGDVRLQRGGDAAWADHAALDLAGQALVLSGRPVLARDGGVVAGNRVTFDLGGRGAAQVQSPRGTLPAAADGASGAASTAQPRPAWAAPGAPLPARCPLPARP